LNHNINTRKKNTEPVIDTSKEVVLAVNTEKTEYMLISCDQNAGRNHNMKIYTYAYIRSGPNC
jgi:hypothetical protein